VKLFSFLNAKEFKDSLGYYLLNIHHIKSQRTKSLQADYICGHPNEFAQVGFCMQPMQIRKIYKKYVSDD